MKDKSFKLVKELLLEQAQGYGAQIQEETDLAKELFCEINGYSLERFEELHQGVLKTLSTSFPYGVGGAIGADWITYRNTYAMLIDSIKYTLEEETAGSQSKDR